VTTDGKTARKIAFRLHEKKKPLDGARKGKDYEYQ